MGFSVREDRLVAAGKRVLLYSFYVVFCTSFFMPAIGSIAVAGTLEGSGANGLEAFRGLSQVYNFWLLLVHPVVLVAFPLLFVANVAALCFPLVDIICGRSAYLALGVTIGTCAAALLLVPLDLLLPVYYGFFVWIVSLLALAATLSLLGWQHLAAGDDQAAERSSA